MKYSRLIAVSVILLAIFIGGTNYASSVKTGAIFGLWIVAIGGTIEIIMKMIRVFSEYYTGLGLSLLFGIILASSLGFALISFSNIYNWALSDFKDTNTLIIAGVAYGLSHILDFVKIS